MEARTLTFTDLVREELAEVEGRMISGGDSQHPELRTAIKQLLSSGGKRLRPILVLLSGGLLGADRQRTITLAAAIELLHTATLVHDDLIDGSLLRRGYPTLNAKWDGGATVLMGDYVFALAARYAADTGSLAIMENFAETLSTIVSGELTQIFGTGTGNLRVDYFNRVYAKTGSLFELATKGAALLAQSEPSVLRSMQEFGRQLGIAFQIVDDILDFTGDLEQVGKPVASDLRHGLVTLPTICHLESQPQDDERIQKLVQGVLSADEEARLIESIRTSGAIEAAQAEAADYLAICAAIMEELPTDKPEHEALSGLAQYVLHRRQ
jgi:geranylgeranyl pyrophosphate synthase